MNASKLHIAFIADGKLFTAAPGALPREVASPFVRGLLERVERDRERSAWKDDSLGWNLNAGAMAGVAIDGAADGPNRARFTALAGGGPGALYYTLETTAAGGLFHLAVGSGDETRVFHKQQTRIGDLARNPVTGMVAMVLRKADGSSHIAVLRAEGGGVQEITEGDVVDGSPSWSEAGGKRAAEPAAGGEQRGTLVYHSAGLARHESGAITAVGPHAILALDLDGDRLDTLVEISGHDCLSPRIGADGALYYIRRPYHPFGPPPGAWQVAKDIVLFPYRVALAFIHFLNFFSLMWTRKPLLTAGGPRREGPDRRTLMLWGKMVDAEKMLNDRSAKGAILPPDWKLIRREPSGAEQEIAERVVAFDLLPDGSLVWTNGGRVLHRQGPGADAGRNKQGDQELFAAPLIERLVILR